MAKNEVGITLEEAVTELASEVETSVDFISSEFAEDWAKAEKYFAGGVDAKKTVGRSTAVKTVVRDNIRALKPSVMRTLLHARKIVEYIPASVDTAPFVEQQGLYVTQLFWANDGYKVIYSSIDEGMKKKIGPVKTYWEESPTPEFFSMTGITAEDVESLKAAPDYDLEEVTEHVLPPEVSTLDGVDLFDVEGRKYLTNGRIRMEAFPANEFFISRDATGVDNCFVHGHRRNVTVAEAMSLGIEYDDWITLDLDDPETNEHVEESEHRRGYNKNQDGTADSEDLLLHEFSLIEVYVSYDLKGTGRPQKYMFYLGGTSYTYLDHSEIEDWCIDLVEIDPVPFTTHGRSIFDISKQGQDNGTSVMRAILDNAHQANNPRPVANPMLVDFADLMNPTIGAPIKNRSEVPIQMLDTPFTGQTLLPLMQYMEMDEETKVGVTKAAQGLDTDAMQSTDKDAVRNTIAMSQGQTELMVRNIIETGLIPIFRRLLKLSMRHMDRNQVIRMKGVVLPISTAGFDPELVAEAQVGLGTTSPEQKVQALGFVLQKQEAIMAQFGMDNPFTSLSQIYNTLEELVELSGLYNVGRYFKVVTPEIEQQLAAQKQQAMEEAKARGELTEPMDPSTALLKIQESKAAVQQGEAKIDAVAKDKDRHLRSVEAKNKDDLARDKMIQDRELKLLEVREKGRAARAADRIARQQLANNPKPSPDAPSDTPPDTA